MATFKFHSDWLEMIRLLEEHGTTEDRDTFWSALLSLVDDDPSHQYIEANTVLGQMAFAAVRRDVEEDKALSSKRKQSGANRSKTEQTVANVSKREQNEAKEKEEREEEREAERETAKENFPHTPLKEKDKEKGEEGEEAKEEREIISRPLRAEVCEIALPEPQFIAETDPKKLTDRMLEEEFDALWLLYPRKDGRKDALRHYKAARREGVTFDEVESGIKRYANYVRDKDPTYTAMGSTWFCGHRWEDRIENHGPRPGSMAWLANIANGGALDDS